MIKKSTTQLVLEVFFKNPNKEFHLRELSRVLKLSMPTIISVTDALSKESLIIKTKGMVLTTVIANRKNVNLRYEAAVCGGIPIIRTLEEYFAHDEIMKISGIINGTSNYILTQMHQGKTLEEALHEAQSKGFAEADPTNDVEGIDALQKLVLLSSLAFHTKINPDDVLREGITQISDKDIFYLQRMLSPPRNEVYAIK
ncbi:hypothetical protein HYU06_05150, partial [Candidatus Woesearchaeota archaeon]|nr:hypothetical protein [Candidatus Woesearchaeota archaeon]